MDEVLKAFRPGTRPAEADLTAGASLAQRSPTLQSNPQNVLEAETSDEAQRRTQKNKAAVQQYDIEKSLHPPPINTSYKPGSAPPGFGRPPGHELAGTPRSPTTPVFHYFQPPGVRRGWEGFVHTFEQEQHTQFLKAITKGPRMEFPRFDGVNPGGWIRQCNKYFQMAGVPEEYKVSLAQLYIVGRADVWLRLSKILNKRIAWSDFCDEEVLHRFSPTGTFDLAERFNSFKKNNLTIAEYTDQFED
uniref:Uncharacterized protein n=1 Tax=Avena sativa TaxID=4498 RepID=A0ACD6AMJ2_AVESA